MHFTWHVKLGIVAATDTHNGNPGAVEEYSYQGWSGITDDTREERITKSASPMRATNTLIANPGGLAGVWAEENSRDAIFNAMKRKETFGTSGPRITARFFGGWDYPEDLCGDPELVSKGYAGGVPMGGDLPAPPSAEAAPVATRRCSNVRRRSPSSPSTTSASGATRRARP